MPSEGSSGYQGGRCVQKNRGGKAVPAAQRPSVMARLSNADELQEILEARPAQTTALAAAPVEPFERTRLGPLEVAVQRAGVAPRTPGRFPGPFVRGRVDRYCAIVESSR